MGLRPLLRYKTTLQATAGLVRQLLLPVTKTGILGYQRPTFCILTSLLWTARYIKEEYLSEAYLFYSTKKLISLFFLRYYSYLPECLTPTP